MPQVELYIDSRMGAQVALLYAINPADPEEVGEYEKTLYPSSEAMQERCTARAIIYTVLGLSAQICRLVKKYLMHEPFQKQQVFDFS